MTYLTEEERERRKKENESHIFYSSFNFLRGHYGIRPKELHLLLGTSGSGKSTLARSIITDCARDKKVLLWASEEPAYSLEYAFNNITRDERTLKNISIYSEITMPTAIREQGAYSFMEFFREKVMSYFPDIIFIDNITTSYMYSERIGLSGQEIVAAEISKFIDKNKIPIFVIAHTKKGIVDNQDKLIDTTDIRGNSAIANAAGYAYVLQNFRVNNTMYPFIHLRKHRYHSVTEKYYQLQYEDGKYYKDRVIDFNLINEIYKLRNRLKGKYE